MDTLHEIEWREAQGWHSNELLLNTQFPSHVFNTLPTFDYVS